MHELEVPEVVVCSLCLWYLVVWLWLASMDDIGKLDRILDKEDPKEKDVSFASMASDEDLDKFC